MTAVADILPIAKPQGTAAAPVPTGDGEDFFDHLLREVERQEAIAAENPDDTGEETETADAAAAPADAPAPPPPALTLPWSMAAAAPELAAPQTQATPASAPQTATAPVAPTAPLPADDTAQLPATPAIAAPPTPVAPAAPQAGATQPSTPAATPTAAANNAAPVVPAPTAAAAPAASPTPKPVDAAAAANAGMTAPEGVAAPEGDAAEAESILQVMGPRLPQATAPAPATPPVAQPIAINEPAPLRSLREPAPAPSTAATGVAVTASAGTASSSSGGAKTGSGDLGFKTDLGSVFAALSAGGEAGDATDFRNLIAGQASRGITTELPAAEPRVSAPAAGAAATAGTPIAAATPPQAAGSAEPVQHASAGRHVPTPPPTPATLQISVQMIRAIGEGVSKINIDLTPAELGRVAVRIEVGSDGRVQGTVTADRQDTFDMLQRDSRALERALQDAGLKADPQSLSFNLRGEGQQGRTAPENPAQETFGTDPSVAEDLPPPPPPPGRPASNPVGAIDIRV